MATLKLFDEKHVKEIAKAINRKNEQINKQHKNNGFFEYDNNDDPFNLFLSNSKFKCCSCKEKFTKKQDIIKHIIGNKLKFVHTECFIESFVDFATSDKSWISFEVDEGEEYTEG